MILSTKKREELYWPYVEIVKDCRKIKGLTQAELSLAADLSDKYVTMVEGRKRQPTLENLLAMASAAGVRRSTMEQLLDEVMDHYEWEE